MTLKKSLEMENASNADRTAKAVDVFGADLINLLSEASIAIDLLECQKPPFEKYAGYVSTYQRYSDLLAPDWPEFSLREQTDQLFGGRLKKILREHDRSAAFLTGEPESAYPLIRLLDLMCAKFEKITPTDSVFDGFEVTPAEVENLLDVILERLSHEMSGINRIVPKHLRDAAKSRYGTDYWIAIPLKNEMTFTIQIVDFQSQFLQFSYYLCGIASQAKPFRLSGLPAQFWKRDISEGLKNEHREIQNLTVFCKFLSTLGRN